MIPFKIHHHVIPTFSYSYRNGYSPDIHASYLGYIHPVPILLITGMEGRTPTSQLYAFSYFPYADC
ncbi:hypothetical protein SAMN05444064_1622 [Pseudomonas syringae]|nr:hypothetical protein SAMN05444514_1612 [Pseudomonas syringae]SFM87453.1 hypothetical protein SAMN05444064_1622 [Pseudomonas syringae]